MTFNSPSITVLPCKQAIRELEFHFSTPSLHEDIQSEACSLLKSRTTHLLGRGKFHHWKAHWQGDIKGGQCANVEPNAPPDFAFGCLRAEINMGLYIGIEKGELYTRIKDTSLMYFKLFRHTIQQAERPILLSLFIHCS